MLDSFACSDTINTNCHHNQCLTSAIFGQVAACRYPRAHTSGCCEDSYTTTAISRSKEEESLYKCKLLTLVTTRGLTKTANAVFLDWTVKSNATLVQPAYTFVQDLIFILFDGKRFVINEEK